jgi:hypothetical protein
VRILFEDREGDLWVGGNHGLTRLRDDAFTVYGKPEGLPRKRQRLRSNGQVEHRVPTPTTSRPGIAGSQNLGEAEWSW